MRKFILLISALALSILLLAGCAKAPEASEFAGNTYVYDKEGAGGQFAIIIHEDGTFTYYEGMLSSYIAVGQWTLEKDMIRLADNEDGGHELVNYFRFENGRLVFVEKRSSNFLYVDVEDGDTFRMISLPEQTTESIE